MDFFKPGKGGEDESPVASTASLIGILVAIAGNVVISFALNLQKLAHKRLEEESRENSRNGTPKPPATPPRTENSFPFEEQPLLPQRGHRSYSQPSPHDVAVQVQVPQTRSGFVPRSPTNARIRGQSLNGLAEGTILEEERTSDSSAGDHHNERVISWFDEESQQPDAPKANGAPAKNGSENMRFNGSSQETGYLKSKLWWIGFTLLNVGELGNFLSYAFAPASVVAPLGTFALIANCFFAPLMLKERFRKRDLLGIAISIVGAVTVVLASKSSDVQLDPDALLKAIQRTAFVIYTSVVVALAIILSFLSERSVGQEFVYIDVGLCALFGGFTVLATKAVSTLLSLEGPGMFAQPITYPLLVILLGTGVGQIKYLNRALMAFDSKVVVPTQFVLFTMSAIIGSSFLYRDFDNISPERFVVFLYGCATTFVGTFILTRPDISLAPDPSTVEQGEASDQFSTPTLTTATLPYTPLLTPRTLRIPAGTPILRHRNSRASLGFSPALLLLATSPGSSTAPPSQPSVPITRTRTRSESRGQRESDQDGGGRADSPDTVREGRNSMRL